MAIKTEGKNFGTSIEGDEINLEDNDKLIMGTGNDASIYYDGADLVINPREVGAGIVKIFAGDLQLPSGNNLFLDGNIRTVSITNSGSNIRFIVSNLVQLDIPTNALMNFRNNALVANVVSPTAPNRTISIQIDGVTYYLHAKTTND